MVQRIRNKHQDVIWVGRWVVVSATGFIDPATDPCSCRLSRDDRRVLRLRADGKLDRVCPFGGTTYDRELNKPLRSLLDCLRSETDRRAILAAIFHLRPLWKG